VKRVERWKLNKSCVYARFFLPNKIRLRFWDPFLEGPEKFSHPESRTKFSKLITSELFYAHILNINRGSFHTRSFRRIHLSVFKYRLTKNGFAGPKSFRRFRETGPGLR